MTALVVAVFLASLLGSTHCAGMCGAFVVFAVAGPGTPDRRSLFARPAALHASYNIGRLIVYTALGASAGAAGATLELGADLVGVQHAAAIGAGLVMAGYGVVTLLRLRGVRIAGPRVPKPVVRLAERGHKAALKRPPVVRAFLTGLLTTLLPCGWLYAFVVTSAGTGHPLTGALVMAVFWLGTLPMLVGIGALAKRITGPLGRRLPAITACALVVIGITTVVARTPLIDTTGDMLTALERDINDGEPFTPAALLPDELPCHEYRARDAH